MSFMDKLGLSALADRIAARFPFREEAVGSGTFDGKVLALIAVDGGTLSTLDLDQGLANDGEAAHAFQFSGTVLTVKAVDGTTLATIDIGPAIQSAIGSATGGLMSESTANGRFGNSLSKSGNTLKLVNYNGTEISSVTL